MRRAEEDLRVPAVEVAARRLAEPGGDSVHVRAVDIHDEFLVAATSPARRLEDQPSSVRAEIGLGVLSAKRELADIRQMRLPRLGGDQR